ncbi:hypothetical protein HAX54_011473 [Datura stramonium]|uniref:BZIP domain-containing protein n=1 Tax=Datura stramonium TaxID=4076 RepID=A0ABS8TJZ3_DATST|nr:hypothetical protein [Datura stramonium]
MNYENTCKTTPSCTADDRFSGDVENELVECERESAEALACLSHPASTRDSNAGEIELFKDAGHIRFASNVRAQQFRYELWTSEIMAASEKGIARKSEYESELKASLVCDLNYPPVTSRKSRQELTEAEKAVRRLRRILANRESARRSVRQRQAMQEELKRKAADLALENENLKKKKELAAAEYNSEKNKNNNLRMQIAQLVKAEVEETDDDSKSTPVETPTSTTSPTFLLNQSPKVPLILSTVFPPSDGDILQSGSQSTSGITPQTPTSLGGFKPSDELESSVMMNKPWTPLYVVSCLPWQMQFDAQTNPFHPITSYPNDQHKTCLVHECSTSTSKTTVNMEDDHLKETPKVETKTPINTMPRDFLHEADRDFVQDEDASEGSRQLSGLRSHGLVQVPPQHQEHVTHALTTRLQMLS